MAINTTTLEANLTTKINNTSGTTDGKEFLLLGKAVEAVNTAISNNSLATANNLSDVANAATARTNLGLGTMAVETATDYLTTANATSTYAPLAGATFTGAVNGTDLTLSGNLTVNGTQTVINSATMTVDDLNITVASGAADAAAANGAGLTVDGASATFNYNSSFDKWTMNKGLVVSGAVTADSADITGTLKVDEVIEKVEPSNSTTGTINFDFLDQAIINFKANQTANRTINFRGNSSSTLDSIMAVNESITCAIMMAQGSTAYYLNAYQIDGSSVTPKWVGGAPTGGTASAINTYTFTIVKTASATFTVLANLTAYE